MPCHLFFIAPLSISLVFAIVLFVLMEKGKAILPQHAKDNKEDKRRARVFEIFGFFVIIPVLVTVFSIPNDAQNSAAVRTHFIYHWCINR